MGALGHAAIPAGPSGPRDPQLLGTGALPGALASPLWGERVWAFVLTGAFSPSLMMVQDWMCD